MKIRRHFLPIFAVVMISISSCVSIQTQTPTTVPITKVEPTATTISTEIVIQKPIMEVTEDAFCYSGPGTTDLVVSLLVPGQFFEIIGIDDDVTWFQIDPNELVDPNPPHSPLNALVDPDPPHSPRCWVFSESVQVSGDLSGVPIVQMPRLGVLVETHCYTGPGYSYPSTDLVDPDQFFDIIGIDDDVTWSENGNVEIDDDVTWFQIDADALITPDPSSSSPNRLTDTCSDFYQPTPQCWLSGSVVEYSGDLSMVPVIDKAVLEIISGTACYSGPGKDYASSTLIDAGQLFEIVGIDDDVTWVDDSNTLNGNSITWIDDDVTWFQINPNAIIDPTPPSRPLNELSPQPDPPGSQMSLRCWVPGSSVETGGDLLQVPIILRPTLQVNKESYCYFGPGSNYKAVSILPQDQVFKIIGVGSASNWYQIDPNVVVDPEPPHRILNEIIDPVTPSSTLNLRCWVHENQVETCGNLSILPVIPGPVILPVITPTTTALPSDSSPSIDQPSPNCSDFSTPNDCGYYGSNMGCVWEPKIGCYKP